MEAIEKSQMSSSENDRILVRTLKNHESAFPVLLTADEAITDICKLHNVEHFLFKLPYSREVRHCTHRQLRRLAQNLAGVFGFIKINSAIIYGEYRGKRYPDEYKIHLLDDGIRSSLIRDIQICRKIVDLRIS